MDDRAEPDDTAVNPVNLPRSARAGPLDGAALLERRRANFRQKPGLRVRSAPAALRFVNEVGC